MISGVSIGRYFAHIRYMGRDRAGDDYWYLLRLRPCGRSYSAEITARDSQVRAWFGANVYRWCREHPGKKLDVATALRWGLTEAIVLEERGGIRKRRRHDL